MQTSQNIKMLHINFQNLFICANMLTVGIFGKSVLACVATRKAMLLSKARWWILSTVTFVD